jgi:hypothetical protein
MRKILLASVALTTVLALSSVFADEKPMAGEKLMQLSATQMENVTAGSSHINQIQTNIALVEQNQFCLVCVGVGGSGQVQWSEVYQENVAVANIRGRRR